jgi:anaerobic carbon-monoxide dehydrogenase iron sulfur subunit
MNAFSPFAGQSMRKQVDAEDGKGLSDLVTRRTFLQGVVLGGMMLGGMAGASGLSGLWFPTPEDSPGSDDLYSCPDSFSMIVVDYDRCAGCRTCETVCAAFHDAAPLSGGMPGPGNPYYAKIQVLHFNPDVTIPVVCAMCPDTPCITNCTSTPDAQTGRKALYRDPGTGAIKHNQDQCERCGTCAQVCARDGVGIIRSNRDTVMPERLCTLCEGDPQCVAYCPQKALSYEKVDPSRDYYRMLPEELAEELAEEWYG